MSLAPHGLSPEIRHPPAEWAAAREVAGTASGGGAELQPGNVGPADRGVEAAGSLVSTAQGTHADVDPVDSQALLSAAGNREAIVVDPRVPPRAVPMRRGFAGKG